MNLYELYCALLNETRAVATNSYLQLLAPCVEEVESASKLGDVLAKYYCQKMRKLLEQKNLMTKGQSVSEFAQVLGEAHFAVMCKKRGVELEQIKEQKNRKTPDFRFGNQTPIAHFEIKTFSIVEGEHGINADLSRALNAQIEIKQQINEGAGIAISTSEVRPYGELGHKQGMITTAWSTLLDKASNNMKPGQYCGKNTFLVLNLCLIPPVITDNRALRPAYCDNRLFPKPITGELWMLAFSKPGMLIHGQPEFEGAPCLEGFTEKYGILTNSDYSDIAGMLVVVYPWRPESQIYGLYRSSDCSRWEDEDEDLVLLLQGLTGKQWNDDRDTNGWQLAEG